MVVKDISATVIKPEKLEGISLQRRAAAIPNVQPDAAVETPVNVSVDSAALNAGNNQPRHKLNQVINLVNLLSEAKQSIGEMVDSVAGILEQVDSKDLPDQRRAVLEGEAKELAANVNQTVKRLSGSVGSLPDYSLGQLQPKVEEELRRALDVIFPPEDNKMDLGRINFSRKEAILETRVSVERVRTRLEELSAAIRESSEALKEVLAPEDEVALANASSAQASMRDIRQASELSRQTSAKIESNPAEALQSAGNVTKANFRLLE